MRVPCSPHARSRRIAIRLIVDLDGGQHAAAAGADQRRTEWLKRRGYEVLRFWNDDVLARSDAVLADIVRALEGL